MLKDVDGTLVADAGQLTFEGLAKGGIEGDLKSAVKLKSTSDGAADVELNLTAKNMRAGLVAGEGIDPRLVPPTSIDANLRASGASARKLASSANGQVLLTQGPGKTKGDLLGMFGGDIFAQLASKLNPFSAQDPYTQLDCTVARVDIVDGRATVEPVLMQSKKVTVTASGKVDLHTEELTVDFNTRPREGIGVSPGMFTNPFIKLEGTLASPRIAVGAKGAASGAVAVATAGVSVVAKGVVDRARGEVDACKKTLEESAHPAAPATLIGCSADRRSGAFEATTSLRDMRDGQYVRRAPVSGQCVRSRPELFIAPHRLRWGGVTKGSLARNKTRSKIWRSQAGPERPRRIRFLPRKGLMPHGSRSPPNRWRSSRTTPNRILHSLQDVTATAR